MSSTDSNDSGAVPADPLSEEGLETAELLEVEIPPGTLMAGRYRIDELLGEGAMGAVYRAEHVHMRKPFAVKVLHAELTEVPEVVARFEREAIAAGRIDHPNVARAHDFGQLEDGTFYLVLEFVEGHSLADVLDEDAPLEPARAMIIARQIAAALHAAHTSEIVHRDLKPENVMLVDRFGMSDFVKVLDFGIAKIDPGGAGPALTRMGAVFGTPHYMAPEQAAGQTVDPRADLYTLGLMLYEMLTGAVPFLGDDPGSVVMRQITEVPAPLPDHIDPDLARLVMTQLEKSPDARLQTADDVLEQLDILLGKLALIAPGSVRVSAAPASLQAAAPVQAVTSEPRVEREPVDTPPETISVRLSVGSALASAAGLLTIGVLLGALGAGAFSSNRASTDTAATAQDLGPTAAPLVVADDAPPEVLARAATGDQAAIADLEKRPEGRRSAQLWLALARGRFKLERFESGVRAYDQALRQDPKLKTDRTLLRHVSQAAHKKDTSLLALDVADRQLGAAGADLLYEVWVATKAKTNATSVAKALVYSEGTREKASPALNAVLDLREAKTCDDYKKLLPVVALNGDTRTARVLAKLKNEKGCGQMQREDCWECLRGDSGKELDAAITAVRSRPQPRF